MLRGIVTIVAFIDVVKNDKFQRIVVMSILLLKRQRNIRPKVSKPLFQNVSFKWSQKASLVMISMKNMSFLLLKKRKHRILILRS